MPSNLPSATNADYIMRIQEEILTKLDTRGGSMAGTLNMAGYPLVNTSIFQGQGYLMRGDEIVSNPTGVGAPGSIATFASPTILNSSGIQLGDMLHLSGGNMTGAIDSLATLSLGTSLATSVSVGRSSVISTINGLLVSPLPKATWYSLIGVTPSFTANVFRAVPLPVDNSQGLVDFTINNTNGNLTYTGTRARTFVYTCNLDISFTNPSTLSVTVNKNVVTGFSNSLTGHIWNISIVGNRLLPFHMSDQITLAPGDTLILVARWGNTSAAQVTFGRCSFQISALPN